MKAMTAHFFRTHIVADLPLSLYDLSERDDSTHLGKIAGLCILLLSTILVVFGAVSLIGLIFS